MSNDIKTENKWRVLTVTTFKMKTALSTMSHYLAFDKADLYLLGDTFIEVAALDELKAELENYAKLANRAIEDEAAGVTENDKLKAELAEAKQSELEATQLYNNFVPELNQTRFENAQLKEKLRVAEKEIIKLRTIIQHVNDMNPGVLSLALDKMETDGDAK
jgi:predicted nuclease with TOPRIM domain